MGKICSCGQEIEFVFMPTGRKMPVELPPVKAVVIVNGVPVVKDARLTHWGRCRDTEQYKKKVDSGAGI